VIALTYNAERIDCSLAVRLFPFEFTIGTPGAVTPRIKDDGMAGFALLIYEFPCFE
jgi:hypothetical protein